MELEVVERAKHGDHAAYATLVRDLAPRLYGIALRVTGDQAMADDAVQEGLIHAWRHLPALRDPARFEAWITQIVVRRCYREIQRRPASGSALADADDWAAPGDHGSGLEDRDEVESSPLPSAASGCRRQGSRRSSGSIRCGARWSTPSVCRACRAC